VDDDAVVRLAISGLLRKKGYEVVTAADCSEAIGAIAQGKPEVILVDLTFPPDISLGGTFSWDGLCLMSWLRGLKNAKGTRFIVITSSDSEEHRKRAQALGVAGFFRKPINPERLVETIASELSDASTEQTPPGRNQPAI
jgi:CheY-like chemotaxis protein